MLFGVYIAGAMVQIGIVGALISYFELSFFSELQPFKPPTFWNRTLRTCCYIVFSGLMVLTGIAFYFLVVK
jgi:hypothetical protein